MPNIKSTEKRMRQSVKARAGNRAARGKIVTLRAELLAAVEEKDAAAGRKLFSAYSSALDKAVKRGAIAGNTANRRKARAAARLASLSA
jgi:small subunit ribosomal protein S20